MTIKELGKQLTPRELSFNENAAETTCYKVLRKPKIAVYRHRRLYTKEALERLNLLKENILMRLDDLYTRAIEAKPHMVWNPEKNVKEHDGTWVYDSKTAVQCLRLMAELLDEEPEMSLDEFLKNLGEEQNNITVN
jgi:hypothetical protein